MNTMHKLSMSGLVALAIGVSGCDVRAGGDYDRIISMPGECNEVISAGFSNSTANGGIQSNWDWISCKDAQGGVTIYRMNKNDPVWYKTEIKK